MLDIIIIVTIVIICKAIRRIGFSQYHAEMIPASLEHYSRWILHLHSLLKQIDLLSAI